MMGHGIQTDLTPVCLGGIGSMVLQEEEFPIEWDEEKLFIKIFNPVEGDLEELEIIEVNSPVPGMAMDMNLIRRGKKGRIHNGVILEEWRKRLTMSPEDMVPWNKLPKANRNSCIGYFFPMVKAIRDYSRNVEVPSVLKTDNAQCEVGRTWSDHCRHHCIKQENTKPDHPWQNRAEAKIGQLNSM
eukprot:487023-Ditylum_brightwellii.AAC.1